MKNRFHILACATALTLFPLARSDAQTAQAPSAPAIQEGASGVVASEAQVGSATKDVKRDPYDISRMELKSPPAVVTNERHSGPFAAGNALSMEATLKPLSPEPVKEVRLDTTHKIIDLAPGIKFSAWTFGDTVPGPVVRAKVGDRIKFTMTNRSDEPVPGVRVSSAPMMHSMDFHSAMVSPSDKYRSVAPGQTISFEFRAN